MPPAPPVVEGVTGTGDQARPTGTPAPAPSPAGRGHRKAQLLLGRAARRTRTALPAVACQQGAGSAGPEGHSDRPRRVAGLPRWVPKTARGHYDPLFDRPDLVENDYYRFRNYPHG